MTAIDYSAKAEQALADAEQHGFTTEARAILVLTSVALSLRSIDNQIREARAGDR